MLSNKEKEIFGKVAWTIFKKGHLTISAIVKFTNGATKEQIKKFIKLQLLIKYRTDTFELSQFGRVLGFKYNPRFKKQ